MSQNGQAHFKNLAANAARFLKCVWQFCKATDKMPFDAALCTFELAASMLKINFQHDRPWC